MVTFQGTGFKGWVWLYKKNSEHKRSFPVCGEKNIYNIKLSCIKRRKLLKSYKFTKWI